MTENKKVRHVVDELDSLLLKLNKESAVDTSRQSEEELKKDTSSTKQNNIGVEQEQASKETGSTSGKTPEKKETGEGVGENVNTTQMDIDTKAESASKVLPKVKKTNMSTQEKQARAVELGEGIVTLLDKMAKEENTSAQNAVETNKQAAEGSIELPEGLDKDQFNEFVKVANDQAGNYFSQFLSGMVKRAQDRQAVESLDLDKNTLTKLGGVDGILDKLAAEEPEAVLPPEVLDAVPAEGPVEEAPVVEAAPADVPMEEAPEGAPDDLDTIAEAMAQLGVTPEILDQAMDLIEELKAKGYDEEQIAEAAAEMLQEQAVPAEGPVEEAPVEAPVDAPVEAPVDAPVEGPPADEELPEEKVAMETVMNKLHEKIASKTEKDNVTKIRELIRQKAGE